MCGITGWVSYRGDLRAEPGAVTAMTDTMACRGPDADGAWVRRAVALGHRRLAVIDLPGGTQPMEFSTPDYEVALTYSGEAYNFAELRAELRARGHVFRTDSDTEVVLHGYLEWGAAVAEHLNGMYAFAVWDSRSESLLLVRDRMGIKPLYYHPTPDGVLFGSEPKAILANPLAGRAVDLDGLRGLFGWVKTPGWALWRGMHEVPPGAVVTVSRNGIRTDVYWALRTAEHTDDLDTTVATVGELMDDIVGRQLVADVPRCVLLSGGLDSSVLTGLAAKRLAEQGERVRTFAVDFAGQEENFRPDVMRDTPDSPYIRDVAAHVGSAHRDIVLDAADLTDPDVRRRMLTARDIPVGLSDMDVSLHLLFKAVRTESTVALSGESADEVFGGYRSFHTDAVRNARTFPWVAAPSPLNTKPDHLPAGLAAALDIDGYIADQYTSAVGEIEHRDGDSELERTMRVMSYLHLQRFVRLMLDRKDRASMSVGLEVRVPFCDHRLVEYVYNTPWAMKSFDGREKSLLRAATGHVLPRSVLERTKSPYPSTQDVRYAATLQQQAKELLIAPDRPVFALVERSWLEETVQLDPRAMAPTRRTNLDRVLDFDAWFELYRPELILD
ncbi:asparagine synthase (glutamine-hydrolyzing) [Actinokineospora guangxiensis]|uniref:asparagine synthase (glutamine-hydrolyzing) n=1 Tax=Actinokineospora guangxiensis TaxID=1490288 RepID=A0ABW0EKC1_9PSEU